MLRWTALAALLWCYGIELAVAAAANADQAVDAVVPAQEIVETLRAPRTRGLVKVPGQPAAPDAGVDRIAFPNIHFALNSAQLLPTARAQLNEIGQALGAPELAGLSFEVRGHTDVSGNAGFNQQLSQARAAAVGAYLQREFSVDTQRLRLRGVGARQLRDDLPAADPGQRRVELIRR